MTEDDVKQMLSEWGAYVARGMLSGPGYAASRPTNIATEVRRRGWVQPLCNSAIVCASCGHSHRVTVKRCRKCGKGNLVYKKRSDLPPPNRRGFGVEIPCKETRAFSPRIKADDPPSDDVRHIQQVVMRMRRKGFREADALFVYYVLRKPVRKAAPHMSLSVPQFRELLTSARRIVFFSMVYAGQQHDSPRVANGE